MQKEIIVQCLANMGALSMLLMVQAYGYKTGELTWLEVFGRTLWLVFIAFEHTADKQKKAFVKDCLEKNVKNAVWYTNKQNISKKDYICIFWPEQIAFAYPCDVSEQSYHY